MIKYLHEYRESCMMRVKLQASRLKRKQMKRIRLRLRLSEEELSKFSGYQGYPKYKGSSGLFSWDLKYKAEAKIKAKIERSSETRVLRYE